LNKGERGGGGVCTERRQDRIKQASK